MHKTSWMAEFVEALQKLRPLMPRKFAWTVAAVEYGNHGAMSPDKAAKQWAERKV